MKKLILITALLVGAFSTKGQSYLSTYNFNHLNQNLLVNPASPSLYNVVVGIPGLGNTNVYFNGSSNWGSLFKKDTDANQQFESILDNLNGKERFNLNQTLDVLFVGFRLNKGYLTFGAQEQTTYTMTFPGELIKFLYYGNVGSDYFNKTLDMSSFNASGTSRINYHIGYQYQLDSNLTVGGRYKYISGLANFNTTNFDATLYSDASQITVNTDILFQSSGSNIIDEMDQFNIQEQLMSKNRGMSFDLGAHYKLNEKIEFSVSALDIGFIKWKKGLKQYQSKGQYTFEGVDIDYKPNDTTDFGDRIENVLDTLSSKLNFTETQGQEYTSNLPMHILASVQYNVTPKHTFNLTYHGTSWNNRLYSSYGVQYIGKWHRMFHFMAGYSVLDQVRNNISLGLSARLGFLQIYAMSDNVFGVIKPTTLAATSVRFGLNITFYNKNKGEKKESKKNKNKTKKDEKDTF